jgi:hypothetical protein
VTKNEIIAKTLMEMRRNQVNNQNDGFNPNEEIDYDELVIPVLRERLPDQDIKTCEDFNNLKATCCDTCHTFYAHADMHLENLPTGGMAWICCSVRTALLELSKRSQNPADEVDLLKALGG